MFFIQLADKYCFVNIGRDHNSFYKIESLEEHKHFHQSCIYPIQKNHTF